MAQQTRTTLKTYFNTGDTPTEAQFIDLIDSSPNPTDDGTTGSGSYVRATSPTLVTPTLGVATATSVNKVAITAPATGATITPTDGTTTTLSGGAHSGTNTGDQTITLTGDVTGTGTGSFAATIANDAVTNAKLANMATQTIKGRTTAGTGDPEDLTATQATAILNAFTPDTGTGGVKGLVPAPAAGDAAASKFLKADGTWTYASSPENTSGIQLPRPDFSYYNTMESSWSNQYGGDGVTSFDSVIFQEGVSSIKCETPSTANSGYAGRILTLAPVKDWNNKVFRILVRSDDWAAISRADVLISSDSGFTNYYTYPIHTYLASKQDDEWIEIVFGLEDCVVTGAPDITTATKLIVRAQSNTTTKPSVWFDGFASIDDVSNAIITICADDGWDSQYTELKKKMDSYGYKGTFFVIPERIGTASYLSQAQVDSLHEQGHDISGHGDTNLTTLTGVPLQEEVLSIAQYYREHGYRGHDNFAYPNGAVNNEVFNELARYFNTGFSIDEQYQPVSYINQYRITRKSIVNTDTTADIQGWIDDAIANGRWLILNFHKIVTTPGASIEYSIANLSTVIDYIHTSGASVMSVTQALESVKQTKGKTGYDYSQIGHVPLSGGTMTGNLTMLSANIELGHASDTTISRVSAGVIAVEGKNVLTTDGGTLTGSITLGENTGVALDPAGSADGKWSGITIAATAGYAQTFGDLVYLDPTDSRWEKCDANSASGADGDSRGVIGIVVGAGAADGSACTILLNGVIRADAAFPAMTTTAPMYVSETAGAITGTAPATTDAVIRCIGFALTADELRFDPSSDFYTRV